MEEENLSRKERRELFREEKRRENEKGESLRKIRKWFIVALIIFGLLGFAYKVYGNTTSELPGEKISDMGRKHVTDIAGIKYNSNPPTSGTHFPVWAKNGIYDRLISDGYLIHSLEHGYVIISYDCTKQEASNRLQVKSVFAHEEPTKESSDSGELLKHMKISPSKDSSWFTPENPPEVEVELPQEFEIDSCRNLVSRLSEFTKKWDRVIVVPRLGMDTPIALIAWGRIDKLSKFDKAKIENFIKNYRNRGPEKTME